MMIVSHPKVMVVEPQGNSSFIYSEEDKDLGNKTQEGMFLGEVFGQKSTKLGRKSKTYVNCSCC